FCVAQVTRSHQRYLAANVIVFGQPVDPILFVGSAKPTDEDVRRTPFLVRRDKVLAALNWLKLNNPLYASVGISHENLQDYPEDAPPVGIVFRPRASGSAPESLAVYESVTDRETAEGDAPFIVHGLDGGDLARMSYDAKVAIAIRHFDDGHAALAYGHDPVPETIYHNSTLFPALTVLTFNRKQMTRKLALNLSHLSITLPATWKDPVPLSALSPQDIRDRVLADPEFELALLSWLEDCHTGDFSERSGSQLAEALEEDYVKTLPDGSTRIAQRLKRTVRDPATTLPLPPPQDADDAALAEWYSTCLRQADEIVFCSNRHDPTHGKGCWRGDDNDGYCKARFPRELFESTQVDRASGAIRFAKSEPWINTYNPMASYLMRYNSDFSCLLSGTQVKAIVAYVTDYITKNGLSTHTFFEVVRAVLDRNTEMLNDAGSDRDRVARAIIVKIVNALSAASEIGGPAVSAYLLGQPDHYTSEKFRVFYWYAYVQHFLNSSSELTDTTLDHPDDRVLLGMTTDGVVVMNKVNDYVFRPPCFQHQSLYDFMRLSDVRKLSERDRFVPVQSDDASDSSSVSESDSEEDTAPDASARYSAPRAHRFISGHPLRKTHGVFIRNDPSPYVLNFVGRALPRPDKGDREEYCATMLAFFHPSGWRSGRDLFKLGASWSHIFQRTEFSPNHLTVMKNMNVMYECLDARDDYSAQRRAEGHQTRGNRFAFGALGALHNDSDGLPLGDGTQEFTEQSLVDLLEDGAVDARDEGYRLLILGPTGSSAAIIGGSTYHSALGINVSSETAIPNLSAVEKLRGRLKRVDLIFIDEVSMISCHDVWRINSHLAKAIIDSGHTFAGKRVILAGDFAQLAPAGKSPPLYSTSVGPWSSSASASAQNNAIGKALWHQFTTVVLLRENMRQTGMSDEDCRYRVALDNLRHCCLTAEDEDLILSRIWRPTVENAGRLPERFRYVSVITPRNAHRDAINAVRVQDFAESHGRTLTHFYSVDQWAKSKNAASMRQAMRDYDSVVDPTRASDSVTPRLQQTLWELPPALSGHHPGILSLCEGMPVLLKYNEATELCATNGAEAVVESWDCHTGRHGKLILDTLYVRLSKPPRNMQLPGLPPNVVPLVRNKKTVSCMLPIDDLTVSIQREQVMVLPNFAMTDYGSQGRTLENNLILARYSYNWFFRYLEAEKGPVESP
ncbi:hypothetical protein TRAPUB_4922, partial [Trametes pubescens]